MKTKKSKKSVAKSLATGVSIKYAGGTYYGNVNGSITAQITVNRIQERKRVATEQEAKKWLEEMRDGDVPLSPAQIAEAKLAFSYLLKTNSKNSLIDCVKGAIVEAAKKRLPISVAVADYLETVSKSLSKSTIRDYKFHLNHFLKANPDWDINDISREIVKSYADDIKTPHLHNHFLRTFSAFWSWVMKCGYSDNNVMNGLSFAKIKPPKRLFLSVEKTKGLLRGTAILYPELMPYVILSMFAGIRPAEIMRLSAGDFSDAGYIQLSGEVTKSKSGIGRMIEMRDNLKDWLAIYPITGKATPFVDMSPILKRLRLIDRQYTVGLSHDCMRHTYATYAFAHDETGEKLAKEMGHSESVGMTHYRGLVTKEQGKAYFAITPDSLIAEAEQANNTQPRAKPDDYNDPDYKKFEKAIEGAIQQEKRAKLRYGKNYNPDNPPDV